MPRLSPSATLTSSRMSAGRSALGSSQTKRLRARRVSTSSSKPLVSASSLGGEEKSREKKLKRRASSEPHDFFAFKGSGGSEQGVECLHGFLDLILGSHDVHDVLAFDGLAGDEVSDCHP